MKDSAMKDSVMKESVMSRSQISCDDFFTRMHECIDDRVPLDSDRSLMDHARECSSCRAQAAAWQQISAAVMPSQQDGRPTAPSVASLVQRSGPATDPDDEPSCGGTLSTRSDHASPRLRYVIAAAVAASVMMLLVARGRQDSPLPSSPLPSSSLTGAVTMGDASMIDVAETPVDAASWWQDVSGRDWVTGTMPAVRNVRDGVAPLGRSILQAAALLTVGGGDRTS